MKLKRRRLMNLVMSLRDRSRRWTNCKEVSRKKDLRFILWNRTLKTNLRRLVRSKKLF